MSSKESIRSESVESNAASEGDNNNNNSINNSAEKPSSDETLVNKTKDKTTSETNRPGDDGESTDNNDTSANEQPPLESETGQPASDQDIKAAWTEAWDDQSQAYYWWNTITYETAWEKPNDTTATASSSQPERNELDSVLDTIDTKVRAKLGGPSSESGTYQPMSSSYPYSASSTADHLGATDPYRFQAFFNTKTGRFQNSNELAQRHPDQYTMEARARRQMEHYFDVDAYQAERNQQINTGRKRSLSRKEIERFKRAKKEKKANRMREWLRD